MMNTCCKVQDNKILFVFMIKVARPVNELLNIIHKDKVAYFAFAFACST